MKSKRALERDVYQRLGTLPVNAIKAVMVAAVIEAIAKRGARDTAAKILQHLLVEHAIAAFAEMGIDSATDDARRCWRWVDGRETFTKGDLTYAMRHTQMKAREIDDALRVLSARNQRRAGAQPSEYRKDRQF